MRNLAMALTAISILAGPPARAGDSPATVPAMIPADAAVPRPTTGAGGADTVTFTVAKPLMAPFEARTVFVNVPATAPAVNVPVALILPPPLITDHVGVNAMTLPLPSRPTATNDCVVLIWMSAGFGVTVIVASVPLVTVTVANPLMAPLVAFTVLV